MILYLEGGNHLRPPMAQFIRRATGPIDLKIQPCGSGDNAIEECAKDGDGLLLIDSEGEDLQQLTQRVASQIGAANRAFFMVQKMEAWFMADRNALRNHFGAGFRESALPPNRNIEEVSIQDIDNALRNATRDCAKQRYRKGRDDVGLLNLLNPTAVYNACPNFRHLIDHLSTEAGASR